MVHTISCNGVIRSDAGSKPACPTGARHVACGAVGIMLDWPGRTRRDVAKLD